MLAIAMLAHHPGLSPRSCSDHEAVQTVTSIIASNLCLQAKLRVLSAGVEKEIEVELAPATRLIPFHINNLPPSYYIVRAGLLLLSAPPSSCDVHQRRQLRAPLAEPLLLSFVACA